MIEDEVIREMRRIKEEIAAKYGYDPGRIARALRRKYDKTGRKTVARVAKRSPAR